jgi:hypothetical protein
MTIYVGLTEFGLTEFGLTDGLTGGSSDELHAPHSGVVLS